jgi:hypothetical protein
VAQHINERRTTRHGEARDTHLVYTDGFTKELDLVHDLASILGIFFGEKLAKAIALMGHRDPVLGQMDIGLRSTSTSTSVTASKVDQAQVLTDRPSLQKKLPNQRICAPFVEITLPSR